MCRYPAFASAPMITTVLLATILTSSAMLSGENASPNHQLLSFSDIIERAGYIAEEYEVVTEDGYILYMHRIPGGPKLPAAPGKFPILLIHGLLGSSDNWVLQGAENDLAYLLVDSGYDVWLPNARGNFYGKRHERISTEDPKFWQYSWHEIGIYDIPASIDRVLSVTGMLKVSLVGYSLGGTVVYVLLSMRPEYNEKVNVAFIFASVAIVTHDLPGSAIKAGLRYADEIESLFRRMGVWEILPRGSLSNGIFERCRHPALQTLCRAAFFHLIAITNDEKIFLPDIMKYFHGTSFKTLLHLRQIVLSGKFRQFDFGLMRNYGRYGSFNPPEYPLEKMTAPVVLYYAAGDLYTTKQDIDALLKKIPNAVSREVLDADFGHLDFLTRRTAKKLVYENLLQVLDDYTHHQLDE